MKGTDMKKVIIYLIMILALSVIYIFNYEKTVMADEKESDKIPHNEPVLTSVAESIKGKKDGKIIGLTTDMEYRKKGESNYVPIIGTDMFFEAGTYYIRYAEGADYAPSLDVEVIIEEGRTLKITISEKIFNYFSYDFVSHKGAEWGETLTFNIDYFSSHYYETGDEFAVYVNGVEIEQNNDEQYVIENVTTDIEITVTGVVDPEPPTYTFHYKDMMWEDLAEDITFDIVSNDAVEIRWEAYDFASGPDKEQYYISDRYLSKEELEKIDEWETFTRSSIKLTENGKYIVYGRGYDRYGNVKYISTCGILIGKDSPVISGITEGKTYCEEASFTVVGEFVSSVKVDGKTVQKNQYGKYIIIGDSNEHTVTVTDMAGNSTSVKVTVNKNHIYGDWIVEKPATCEENGKKKKICRFCGYELINDIAATGHTYKEPVFTWNEEYSGATAVFKCEDCDNCTDVKQCEVSCERIEPTCNEGGKIVSTAKVIFNAKIYYDTKEIDVPMKDHVYRVKTFVWAKDNSNAVALFVCQNDRSHTKKIECTVKNEIIKESTITEKGEILYIATVYYGGNAFSESILLATPEIDKEEVGRQENIKETIRENKNQGNKEKAPITGDESKYVFYLTIMLLSVIYLKKQMTIFER